MCAGNESSRNCVVLIMIIINGPDYLHLFHEMIYPNSIPQSRVYLNYNERHNQLSKVPECKRMPLKRNRLQARTS